MNRLLLVLGLAPLFSCSSTSLSVQEINESKVKEGKQEICDRPPSRSSFDPAVCVRVVCEKGGGQLFCDYTGQKRLIRRFANVAATPSPVPIPPPEPDPIPSPSAKPKPAKRYTK